MSSERFEVVIVGAGLSGIAAALTLARADVEVLVIERGDFPGAKNLFGGILYSGVLAELIPEFWKVAPIERHIVNRRYLTATPMIGGSSDTKRDVHRQGILVGRYPRVPNLCHCDVW